MKTYNGKFDANNIIFVHNGLNSFHLKKTNTHPMVKNLFLFQRHKPQGTNPLFLFQCHKPHSTNPLFLFF